MDVTVNLLSDGFVRLDGALPADLAASLIDDADRYAFLPPGRHGGGHFAMGSLRDAAPTSLAEWAHTACHVSAFVPNEVTYQRYDSGAQGLGVHRDQRYYERCIVIATLRGMASFAIHDQEPPHQARDTWTTSARDVILLQGWMAPPVVDSRPFHSVEAPSTNDRLMVQLRMNMISAVPHCDHARFLTRNEIDQTRTAAAFLQTPRR